jgi:hypothetical protein
MSTANNVELLLITIVVCALFLAVIGVLIEAMVVVNKVRKLVKKAEAVVSDVESAAETLKHMGKASRSRFPLLTLIHSLVNSKDEK